MSGNWDSSFEKTWNQNSIILCSLGYFQPGATLADSRQKKNFVLRLWSRVPLIDQPSLIPTTFPPPPTVWYSYWCWQHTHVMGHHWVWQFVLHSNILTLTFLTFQTLDWLFANLIANSWIWYVMWWLQFSTPMVTSDGNLSPQASTFSILISLITKSWGNEWDLCRFTSFFYFIIPRYLDGIPHRINVNERREGSQLKS